MRSTTPSARPRAAHVLRVCAAVAGVAGCLALTGCTDDPVPGATRDEISAWLASHDGPPAGADPDAVLGAGSGEVSPADPTPQPPDAGVTVSFPEPMSVGQVHLACLGDGTLDFSVHVTTATQQRTFTYPDVPCGPEETSEPLPFPDATSVRMTPGAADRDGAWSATLLAG